MYEKVGRLKPDKDRDCIRVIVDGLGEIGIITQEDTEELLWGWNLNRSSRPGRQIFRSRPGG